MDRSWKQANTEVAKLACRGGRNILYSYVATENDHTVSPKMTCSRRPNFRTGAYRMSASRSGLSHEKDQWLSRYHRRKGVHACNNNAWNCSLYWRNTKSMQWYEICDSSFTINTSVIEGWLIPGQKKKGSRSLCSERIELENPGWSGFEANSKIFKTWLTRTF